MAVQENRKIFGSVSHKIQCASTDFQWRTVAKRELWVWMTPCEPVTLTINLNKRRTEVETIIVQKDQLREKIARNQKTIDYFKVEHKNGIQTVILYSKSSFFSYLLSMSNLNLIEVVSLLYYFIVFFSDALDFLFLFVPSTTAIGNVLTSCNNATKEKLSGHVFLRSYERHGKHFLHQKKSRCYIIIINKLFSNAKFFLCHYMIVKQYS